MAFSRLLAWKYSITDCGKDNVDAWSRTACSLSLLATMNCARSPTVLDDLHDAIVTFTIYEGSLHSRCNFDYITE